VKNFPAEEMQSLEQTQQLQTITTRVRRLQQCKKHNNVETTQ
jgi:hypothetical protein